MKICFHCGYKFDTSGWQCPECFISPHRVNDCLAFSPELSQSNEGFNADHFSELANIETNNFWFRSRNALIAWSLSRYFRQAQNFFEIGCGTGFVLSHIEKYFPHLTLLGSEIASQGLVYATERVRKARLLQMDARHIPFDNEFDVIGAFDILEHIEEDERVLQQLHQAVRPNGGIIITVPQHMFLWSTQDEYAGHVRRYEVNELKNKVTRAGFKIIKCTSFVSLLLPFMLASRLTKKKKSIKNYDALAELKLPFFVNSVFEKILDFERWLIHLGIPLPLGGSLLLIAKKIDAPTPTEENLK